MPVGVAVGAALGVPVALGAGINAALGLGVAAAPTASAAGEAAAPSAGPMDVPAELQATSCVAHSSQSERIKRFPIRPIRLRIPKCPVGTCRRRGARERIPTVDAQAVRVSSATAIVETTNLSKSFAGYRAVDGVSLSIAKDTIHAIIGPNGAGKTTFFNLLSGFVEPTSGRVTLGGHDVTGFAPHRIARLGMVRSFQINSIFLHLSVLENVKVSLEAKTELPSRFWLPGSTTKRLDARALELLADVGLARAKDTLAAQLSYGHKRALELAISLAQDPAILLLDEPTAGMGTEDIGRITKLIGRVREGRTIVLVEHNLRVVADLSDRITVLQRGKVLVEGSYEEVRRDPRVIDAYLGGGAGAHA
jgi:branched-chain amino acid transport system ATP-binding protein